MKKGRVALGSSVLRDFFDSVNGAFDALRTLTGVNFLDQNKIIDADFDGKYFEDWLVDYGEAIINQLRMVKIDGWENDDLLDCLEYNVYALTKAVATQNADIIYAAMADCLSDVKKAVDKIVKSYDVMLETGHYSLDDSIASYDEDASLPEEAFSYAIAC